MPPTLVAAGYINIDLVARVPLLPGPDQRVTADNIQRLLGGIATNVACAAARLGKPWEVECELISFVGEDPDSEWALAAIGQYGVNTQWVVRQPGGRTTYCLILVEPDGHRAIVSEPILFDDRQVGRRIQTASPNGEPRLLYVDGYRIPPALPFIRQARELGWRTAVDLDGLPPTWRCAERLAELAAHFDVLFVNQGMADAIWPDLRSEGLAFAEKQVLVETYVQAALAPAANHPCTVMLTMGAHGALLCQAGVPALHIPALAVTPVDTTGAGDVFAGVMLAVWLQGETLERAARFAAVGAGLSTLGMGAHGHLPCAQEVLRAPLPR